MKINNYTKHAGILSIAELAKVEYSDSEIYYNYKELAKQNTNTFLETIHTKQGLLSAATIVFEDGSELIITKEIVAVIVHKGPTDMLYTSKIPRHLPSKPRHMK